MDSPLDDRRQNAKRDAPAFANVFSRVDLANSLVFLSLALSLLVVALFPLRVGLVLFICAIYQLLRAAERKNSGNGRSRWKKRIRRKVRERGEEGR